MCLHKEKKQIQKQHHQSLYSLQQCNFSFIIYRQPCSFPIETSLIWASYSERYIPEILSYHSKLSFSVHCCWSNKQSVKQNIKGSPYNKLMAVNLFSTPTIQKDARISYNSTCLKSTILHWRNFRKEAMQIPRNV